MIRLAVPIVLVLLALFGGAVWLLNGYLGMPNVADPAAVEKADQKPTPSAKAKSAEEAQAQGSVASFDVVRIDPDGTSVFAGRAEPGARVTILGDGEPVGTTQADDNGEWTFATEHKFASADPKLTLAINAAIPQQRAEAAPASRPPEPAVAAEAQKPDTPSKAKSVTSRLLKDLESMVEAAREGAPEPGAAEPAGPSTAREGVPEPKVPEPAGPSAAREGVPEPKVPEPAGPSTLREGGPDHKVPEPAAPSTLAAVDAAPTPAATVRVTEPAGAVPDAPAARKTIPVPITFIYNEANFTEDGRRAAALLLEYLQLKRFPKVSLTGHADERGTHEYNLELSSERLQTVEKYLRDGGYKGELELIPKGKLEPFTGVVRSEYDQEELWQLDRRVELIISQ